MLRRFGELDIDDETPGLLSAMSASTIARCLAPQRRRHQLKGLSHTKPGFVRTVVGYHRYDTEAGLLVLNTIRVLQPKLANYFCPQQKLVSKVRHGANVTKK